MRILHTSDWHLGKTLENESRLEEQRLFLSELQMIADNNKVDVILVAGDVYDAINPPAAAEKLFYESVAKLSKNGSRPVVIIAGNHDSPERLGAAKVPLLQIGVIIVETLLTVVDLFENEYFKIINSGEGFFELYMNGESTVFINMPYPSERRLNQALTQNNQEELMQKDYSRKIGDMLHELAKEFREDSINIMTGHFFIAGGEESASERNISLGGSMAVYGSELPSDCQYIAMGHLHRPQKVNCPVEAAFYSGSPIQYSKSEVGYPKAVYLADLKPGQPAEVVKEYLRNYKAIVVWRAKSIEHAIQLCNKNAEEDIWVYLEVETERPIEPIEMKLMRTARKDILEITPIFTWEESAEATEFEERTMEEDFIAFYTHNKSLAPTEETIRLFLELFKDNEALS